MYCCTSGVSTFSGVANTNGVGLVARHDLAVRQGDGRLDAEAAPRRTGTARRGR